METSIMLAKEATTKINLLDDQFTPSEFKDSSLSFLQNTINFYCIQRLTLWERNHSINLGAIDEKIEKLKQRKIDLIEFAKQGSFEGKNIEIIATLEIKHV